jgi:hypothetical protein
MGEYELPDWITKKPNCIIYTLKCGDNESFQFHVSKDGGEKIAVKYANYNLGVCRAYIEMVSKEEARKMWDDCISIRGFVPATNEDGTLETKEDWISNFSKRLYPPRRSSRSRFYPPPQNSITNYALEA